MTIDAIDLDRIGYLAIDMTIPMIVLGKMTIDTMHADIQVNTGHMHCLIELVGIIWLNHATFGIQ